MFPGQISKLSERKLASATTIVADADILVLTGVAAIQNITGHGFGTGGQMVYLIPLDTSISVVASGNVATIQTIAQNKVTCLVYSRSTNKWYPHALA